MLRDLEIGDAGRIVMRHGEIYARDAGFARLVLGTHESHQAARALSAAQGFELTGSRPVLSFGVDLLEQSRELTL